MGLFGAIKESWAKAGAETFLVTIFKKLYALEMIHGGDPRKMAVILMNALHRANPDFLNKNLCPKPPMDEFVAVGAMINGMHEFGVGHHMHDPLLVGLEMLLGNISKNHQLSTLTILEAELMDAAFDFLIESHEPRNAKDAEALRKSKELYFSGYAG